MADPFPSRTGDLPAWCLLAATALAVATLQASDPFSIAPGTAVLPVLGLAVLLGTAAIGRFGRMPRLEAAGTVFLQLSLFTVLGVTLSYMLTALGGAQWDARLLAWDRALGFDWGAIRRAADGSGALARLMGVAYHGLIPQMVVVVVALGALARFDALRVTVLAAILSGLATILLAAAMPAAGNLFDPAAFRHLWPPVAGTQAGLIDGLRTGAVRVLDLGAMQGIVTFPSYHAALAAIFLWAFWGVPWLGIPGGVWAGLTVMATPLVGGHYAVDVLAGLGLAVVSIATAEVLVHLSTGETRRVREPAAAPSSLASEARPAA